MSRGEGGELHSKKDLIMTARQIVKESEEIVKMAKLVAESCTDKKLKRVRSYVAITTSHVNSCSKYAHVDRQFFKLWTRSQRSLLSSRSLQLSKPLDQEMVRSRYDKSIY